MWHPILRTDERTAPGITQDSNQRPTINNFQIRPLLLSHNHFVTSMIFEDLLQTKRAATTITMRSLLLLSLTALAHASDDEQQCTLKCHQEAPCVLGNADFSDHVLGPEGKPLEFHATTNQQGMHCSCPHGWTGLTCNRIFDTCNGDHKCYNGGSCIPGLEDYFGNQQLFCDCAHAKDSEGNRYVGKFCEHRQVDQCDETGTFCVNGGELWFKNLNLDRIRGVHRLARN